MLGSRSPLHVLNAGTIKIQRCGDEILEFYVRLFRLYTEKKRLRHLYPAAGDNLVTLHFKYDQARRRFVEWAQNEIAVVPNFHKRILFSDEAHFWLNGYVNKQNCHIWSEGNPQVYVETPLHPEKLTVWCALWAGGILLQKR
ncbi:hypothetical protein TNCV_2057741 [Trichonephila clavipes]|nr:hypothetical protein TNCV_2057741 [Trichonephila clavipes]